MESTQSKLMPNTTNPAVEKVQEKTLNSSLYFPAHLKFSFGEDKDITGLCFTAGRNSWTNHRMMYD